MKNAISRFNVSGILARFGWLAVLASSLGTSGWSLYFVARHLGAPLPVAIVISTCFDGVALLCADYALKFIRIGESGTGPRLAVFLFAGLSAFLNTLHAQIAHEQGWARLLWATPSISAIVVYEFHTRWERRNALFRANRTMPPLPVMGFWAWVLFPVETPRRMKQVIRYRRERLLRRAAPGLDQGLSSISPSSGESFGDLPESSDPEIESSGLFPMVSPSIIREWARSRGISVRERGSLPQGVIDEYYREMRGETS